MIDLSGAFRLRTAEVYQRWYKHEHTAPDVSGRSGLRPAGVLPRPDPAGAADCESRLLSDGRESGDPAADRVAESPIRAAGIVCDAKSGVSGAGRKPTLKTSFCEVTENFSAYSILDHRHVPEVLMNSGLEEAEFSFTAHLIPLPPGHSRDHLLPRCGATGRRRRSARHLSSSATRTSRSSACTSRAWCRTCTRSQRTNFCDIGVKFDARTGRGVVVSCIDNLVKGAAGQAVQNMNLVLGFAETEGLL